MTDRTQQALVYHQHGEPSEVLRLEETPVPEVGEGEVLLRMRATAIHPSDFGMIAGSYANLRELPAIGGREGVGEVAEVGAEWSQVYYTVLLISTQLQIVFKFNN